LYTALPPPPIFTLSLHDALPIYAVHGPHSAVLHARHSAHHSAHAAAIHAASHHSSAHHSAHHAAAERHLMALRGAKVRFGQGVVDRKSTRLNSSHVSISYAVFCL